MSKLFLYYSLTGNGDKVAEVFKQRGYEIRKFTPKGKMPKTFFFRILTGGFVASLGVKSKLVDFDPDLSAFDEIVVGSPIWNARTTPALNGLLELVDFKGKKVTFLFYSGSGTGKKAKAKVHALYPDAQILFLKEPKKYEEELARLDPLFPLN